MKQVILILSITLIMILPTICTTAESDELHIDLIDVSRGDAMILHQPDSCTILIDTGEVHYADRVIKKLTERGVKTLDMVIITHPHMDHFGGLFDILSTFPANQFFDNGYDVERWPLFDEYKKLRQLQPYGVLTYGEIIHCGEIKISVLHPIGPPEFINDANDTSLVLMISYYDFRLLQMGDLVGPNVDKLVAKNNNLKANVIKVAVHGMKASAPETLLAKVSPEYAVISSSGKDHQMFGHSPADSVLKRFEVFDILHYRTDRDGNIEIIVNQDGFNIRTSAEK